MLARAAPTTASAPSTCSSNSTIRIIPSTGFGGEGFDFRDEFFRFQEVYSRDRVRVLLSIDTEKTDMHQGQSFGKVDRPDNDYALAWVRSHGKGRVFYSTIGHNRMSSGTSDVGVLSGRHPVRAGRPGGPHRAEQCGARGAMLPATRSEEQASRGRIFDRTAAVASPVGR